MRLGCAYLFIFMLFEEAQNTPGHVFLFFFFFDKEKIKYILIKKKSHPSAQGVYKGKEIKYRNYKILGNQ